MEYSKFLLLYWHKSWTIAKIINAEYQVTCKINKTHEKAGKKKSEEEPEEIWRQGGKKPKQTFIFLQAMHLSLEVAK